MLLSSCMHALSKPRPSAPEREKLIAELEDKNILPSSLVASGSISAAQKNVYTPLNTDYPCPPALEKVSSLISLRRGSVSAECVPSPDGINANYPLEQEAPRPHYPKSNSSCALIKEAISSNILFKELDKNQLTDIVCPLR